MRVAKVILTNVVSEPDASGVISCWRDELGGDLLPRYHKRGGGVSRLTRPRHRPAHDSLPINPTLGEGGYPDCVQTVPVSQLSPTDIEANAKTLSCTQRRADSDDQIAIGCVGDSITAGVHSSGGNHTYPGQLQILLDAQYPGKYKVTK